MNNQKVVKYLKLFLIPSIIIGTFLIISIGLYFHSQEKEYKITEKHHKLINGTSQLN